MAIKILSTTKIGNFTMPHTDGTSGQALVTDGNGNISFAHTGSLSALSFSSGTLTATTATGTITVNLDGRYALSSHNHSGVYDNYQSWNLKTNGVQRTTVQSGGTLDLVAGSNVTLSYGAGGVVTIAAASSTETDTLATVTARGASTSTPVTFNGNVTLGNSADLIFSDLAGTFPTSGKGFDWTLNNDGARIYAIQPSSDSIDLVFQLRDNATTNDRFVFWVKEWQGAAFDKYPLIISGGTQFDLKDSALYTNSVLRLSNTGALQNVTGNISMFTNDSGYITGSGSTSGNAGTATRLATARTLTIGSTGKTFDGSANVSWTLAEIGAQAAGSYAAASHTHAWTEITGRPTNVSSFTNDSGYITSSGSTSGSAGTLDREDNRTISPSELTAGKLKYGFTSWGNNNTSPYADFIHLRSYTDASGGNDNLVMFRKDAIGMRIYQQTWGSATAYSTYKDVAFTDGTNSTGTWGISITGSAGSVAWANITGAPSTFTPSTHTHDDRYYTESEIGTFFAGTTAITGYSKTNWDTAYGWGNHASAGYLTSASLSGYATQAYVNTAVANVVNSAPAALDTLNELAAALGNDASFSTTVSTALGNRLRVDTAAQGLTGTQQSNARTNLGLGSAATSNTGDFATSGHTHSAATTAAAGFMSAADKTKLDGIASGATANAGTVTSVSGTGSYGGLTLSGTVTSSGSLTLGGTPTGTWPISISGNADTVDGYHASGLFKLNEWNGSVYAHTDGRIYGTIFYDSNNSAYYADPASNSNLNTVSVRQYYQSLHGEPRNNLGDPTVTDMALFDAQFNNKTELYPASKIKFFTSSDGTNFTEYTGFSDVQKQRLFTGDDNSGVYIPNLTNRFRIELDGRGYVFVSMLYLYWSSNSHSTKIQIWFRRSDNQTWYQHTASDTYVSSWPGHVTLPFPSLAWLEGGNSSGHCDKIRIEFIPSWSGHATYGGNNISLDRLQLWGGYPAGKRNIFHTNYLAEVTFPSNVYSSGGKLATESFVTSQGYLTSVPAQSWSSITGKPTTISGFGITDAITTSNIGSQSVNYATTAGSANAVTWANVSGKPSTFTPSAHTHAISEVTGLQTALDGKQAAGSYVPTSRTLTINGTAYDLSADRSWTISGSDSTKLPLAGGTMTGKIFTVSSGTGTYDGAFEIRETGYASNGQSAWGYSPAISFHWGNRYAKRFGMRSDGQFAVDDAPLALQSWVSGQGYLTGITSSQVTTALGYTPYNNTNPSGYITGSYLDDFTRGSLRFIADYGGSTTWFSRTSGQFIFANAHDWTQTFRLNLSHNSTDNGTWAYFGQQDSNATNGRYRGVRIRKYSAGAAVDGDLSAGAIYIGDTRKDSNWDTAYSWGNHASSGYLTSSTGVTTTYNSSLNSDSRNSRGVTRLYRRDSDSDYSVQTYWTGSYWRLYGYNGDTGHADTHVGYADSAGSAGSVAWSNVSGRPTAVSSFTNDSGYITSSASISGSAGSVAWGNVTGRPGWLSGGSYIQSHNNANSQVNSGFYENDGGGSNWPSQTWYNSINVRHSNQGNYHGFQIAMSYYDNNLWFRSYQGSGTFQSWAYAISNQNIGSQSVNYASSAGNADTVDGYHMNQNVLTSSAPTFSDIYVNGWFRNNANNTGLYNQANGNHFYSNGGGSWGITGNGGNVELQFRSNHQSTLRGYVYGDTSSNFGLLNDQGGWSVMCYAGASYGGRLTGSWSASGDLTAYSDIRVKENVQTIDGALDKVMSLRGVTYNRTDLEDKSKKIGVIAQEVREILPEVVQEQEDGLLSVSYGNMVGVLIEAMKEQQAIIETLEAKIELLTKYLK